MSDISQNDLERIYLVYITGIETISHISGIYQVYVRDMNQLVISLRLDTKHIQLMQIPDVPALAHSDVAAFASLACQCPASTSCHSGASCLLPVRWRCVRVACFTVTLIIAPPRRFSSLLAALANASKSLAAACPAALQVGILSPTVRTWIIVMIIISQPGQRPGWAFPQPQQPNTDTSGFLPTYYIV